MPKAHPTRPASARQLGVGRSPQPSPQNPQGSPQDPPIHTGVMIAGRLVVPAPGPELIFPRGGWCAGCGHHRTDLLDHGGVLACRPCRQAAAMPLTAALA